MENAGSFLMGIGIATGKTRARDAALNAIQSPLLDIGIERATGIVWNITGGSDLTLYEVGFYSLFQLTGNSCTLIWGHKRGCLTFVCCHMDPKNHMLETNRRCKMHCFLVLINLQKFSFFLEFNGNKFLKLFSQDDFCIDAFNK
ncbi:cell division protein FtsZ homolog 2-2, chloroplastic-like [Camellia sinensis]|uniref:cell division protein FtsZ homolog 2-2, chloroplastic-like n=1 Tax=Camellia sinensis TaxID=4442 RepID=UPI001035F3FD|nr:cell division protein FtsZ homolog 2-2, chloroplastic-like [Camellia sinensis]